jgi:hypothetical protein
LEIFLL